MGKEKTKEKKSRHKKDIEKKKRKGGKRETRGRVAQAATMQKNDTYVPKLILQYMSVLDQTFKSIPFNNDGS